MRDFEELKAKYGTEPKEPTVLKHIRGWCHMCERETGTKVLHMRAGLGNACIECGAFRKGKPYLSKREFSELNTLEPSAAKGATHVRAYI